MFGVFRAAAARCARLDAASTGTKCRIATRPTSRCSPFRSASPRWAIRTRGWMTPPGRWSNCWTCGAGRGRGLGDAPWPPHFRKMEGEAPRVAPSRAKTARRRSRRGRRCRSWWWRIRRKEAALAGLERWKAQASRSGRDLAVDDVLVDSMRGRSSTWTRIRVNLRHVPEELRPAQETPDPDDDPTREWRDGRRESRAASAAGREDLAAPAGRRLRAGPRCSRPGFLSERHRRNCAM